ncbi:MAG: sugar ABC transporter ATP-binding protein [Verrucomicrobia bacterium]|nr:sugar ABC transporter ATP-binding protein [Verrucomicrobiota bacterium]
MPEPILKLAAVEKSFGTVRAVKPLDLEVSTGEVLGLVGENGAGKSTLIKILSGLHTPDKGTILWHGVDARFESPHHALQAGIATIHQELAYFPHLSVSENMLMGDAWPRHFWGGVNWRQLHERARQQLSRFDLEISPEISFRELSSAEKQEVAVARALSRQARLLILDEPTASLSEPEVERLFARLNRLRSDGKALIYVSHRLDEILKLTDRIAVLRDGELVANYATRDADIDRIVRDMVGRPLNQVYPHRRTKKSGTPMLELENVTRAGMFRDITFNVCAGEIVGLAGLVGAGRSEIGRAIYGLFPIDDGTMKLCGQRWTPSGAHDSLRLGLAYLPEERKRQGFVADHSVNDSISIGFSDLISRCGLISRAGESNRVQRAMAAYSIRATGPEQEIGMLSGGNQQKAMLARWLGREPQVIILDEPTRGVDVGAKAEIHSLIDRLADSGKAVLLISSDLPEVMGMSDRILVMHRGTISVELSAEAATQENVILAASGLYHAAVR